LQVTPQLVEIPKRKAPLNENGAKMHRRIWGLGGVGTRQAARASYSQPQKLKFTFRQQRSRGFAQKLEDPTTAKQKDGRAEALRVIEQPTPDRHAADAVPCGDFARG
jgi:hypothetical protein